MAPVVAFGTVIDERYQVLVVLDEGGMERRL